MILSMRCSSVFILLSVFTAFAELIEAQMEKCDAAAEKEVSDCLQPMLRFADKLEEDGNEMHFAWYGNAISRELCQIYEQFKSCANTVDCISRTVNAMNASYGYMCGVGYALFKKHSNCFAEVETIDNYIICKNMASEAISKTNTFKIENNLQSYYDVSNLALFVIDVWTELWGKRRVKFGSSSDNSTELCDSMKRYLKCSKPIIKEHCGSEAWTFVNTVTRNSLKAGIPRCNDIGQ
uniref:DUF19 domain-containing protein n=1 Tax=Syphacia muris TaxID=451379 RepID=A0A0N5AK66_9BILA